MSKKKHLFDSNFDPLDQISLLKEKCNNISPLLYRVNSFYLEELRNFLPQTIKTTLFSLITDRLGDDFGFSTFSSRKKFQLKIDKLVSDNMSLITIEHLNELAKEIDEENIRHLNNAKDQMSNALNMKNDSENLESLTGTNSINISSIPPLENLSITEGWNGELKSPYSIDCKEPYLNTQVSESDYLINNSNNEYYSLKDDTNNSDTFNLRSKDIEILQSIFALTDESNLSQIDSEIEDSAYEPNATEDVKNNRFLPQSPIGLYEWMISIDTALVRRLRDLSHSINTELLKSGLVNTLVPINILDAALSGQLISSKSISNILTFKLPINNSLASGGLDIDCLLITPSDMEFDNPRLRKNRTNIKHYQNVLLGMIKQQRYWQARSIAEEVNKEWWKDTTKI
ncbi:adenylate cyclase [Prochlorococcus marinus]|uniref:adenylate cyclase n=1 Tax=Prochlorococcus marinus TaxID=1219 RepID=UPI0022B3F7D9|nr:adenylate cyclase [Prochlorococcus marinus]